MNIFKKRFVRIYDVPFISRKVYHIYIGETNDRKSFIASSEHTFRKVHGSYLLNAASKKDCDKSSFWEWLHNLLFPNDMVISIGDCRIDPDEKRKIRKCFENQDFPKINIMANITQYKIDHPDAVFYINEIYYSRDEERFYLSTEDGKLLPLVSINDEEIHSIYTKYIMDKSHNCHKCDLCAHWNCIMGNDYCKGCISYGEDHSITYSKFEPRGLMCFIHE